MCWNLLTDVNEWFIDFASTDDVCCCFANPSTGHPDVCQKLLQTLGVNEIVFAGRFIQYLDCAGLETRMSMERMTWRCQLLFWVTKVLVQLLVLRDTVQTFLVLFGSNHIKNILRSRMMSTHVNMGELLCLAISALVPCFSDLSKKRHHPSCELVHDNMLDYHQWTVDTGLFNKVFTQCDLFIFQV